VIHNAPFDVAFLDYELVRAGFSQCADVHAKVTDTLALARDTFPGKRNSLDALCERFGVDNTQRNFHGALLDAQLLAEVWLALTRGQETLAIDRAPAPLSGALAVHDAAIAGLRRAAGLAVVPSGPARPVRTFAASTAELAAHAEFLKKLKDPLWLKP